MKTILLVLNFSRFRTCFVSPSLASHTGVLELIAEELGGMILCIHAGEFKSAA